MLHTPGNRSDKDALFQTSVSAKFNKRLSTNMISGGVESIGPGKNQNLPETNCPKQTFLQPVSHTNLQECTEVAVQNGAWLKPDCLDRWVGVSYKDNSLPFSLSGPFALINACWPDETWEQHGSFSPSGFPGLIGEDPCRIFLVRNFFLGRGAICCEKLFRGLEEALL